MEYKLTPYITEEEIRTRVSELAARISEDYADQEILMVGILKGAVVFLTDLLRQVDLDVTVDFMTITRQGEGHDAGVRIIRDLTTDLTGKNVLIVEDILDTGDTLNTVADILRGRGANSLKVCALLDKPACRTTNVPVEYVGFTIPNNYVVGYGMDYEQKYRNLPYIAFMESTEE